ncbi:MAG: hypothetical protein FJX72_14515 [Armatimonadetes bacterium]|nr:hypothetical protein [Armatimonadota bacterium]
MSDTREEQLPRYARHDVAVERIVDLVARSSVRAVTVRAPGLRVTVRKPAGHALEHAREQTHATHDHAVATIGHAAESHDAWAIRAQRVGVFRHADPRIVPGMPVRNGQSVGVIVSMNLPSDVRAHRDGIVSGVLVEDGSPVEFDQPLFSLSGIADLPAEEAL